MHGISSDDSDKAGDFIPMDSRPSQVIAWKGATLRRSDKAPWQARQAVKAWLTPDHPARSDALQVSSELVTNACEHVPPGVGRDWVELRLGFGGEFVRLEVIDPGTPERAPTLVPHQVGSMAESGRGLDIVARLSVRWGTETVRRGCRVVWADLACVTRPESSQRTLRTGETSP
ncbi:ATP-binding protein [Nonomuraea sp. NPDC002799]